MAIERQIDFLGKIISKTKKPPGTQEVLINKMPKHIDSEALNCFYSEVKILSNQKLQFLTGPYEWEGEAYRKNGYTTRTYNSTLTRTTLVGPEINQYDLCKRRNWLGFRVCFRWSIIPNEIDEIIDSLANLLPKKDR